MTYDASVPIQPHTSPRALIPALAALVLASSWATPGQATPLQVRARTQLDVRLTTTDEGLMLDGRLQTDLGRGLGLAEVRIQVADAPTRTVATEDDGRFRAPIALPRRPRSAGPTGSSARWRAFYDGGPEAGPCQAKGVIEDGRAPSRIELKLVPSTTSLFGKPIQARVSVRGEGTSVGSVPVFLRVGSGAELVGATDARGEVVFLIHPALLDHQGRISVLARFPGNHRYGPHEVQRALHILQPSRLTVRVAREGGLERGRYRFSGRLADHRGPMASAAIALIASPSDGSQGEPGLRDAVTQTDAQGRFVFAVPTQSLSRGEPTTLEAQVVYVAGDGLHLPAASPMIRVPVPGPPGVPIRWYGGVALLALVLLLGLQVLRGDHLRRWLAQLTERRRAAQLVLVVDGDAALQPVSPKRPDWLTVIPVNAQDNAPLSPDVLHTTCTDADGAPVLGRPDVPGQWGPLQPGDYTLRSESPGYLPLSRSVTVPHDGSLDGLRLPLTAVRGHVLGAFVRGLARFGVRLRWGYETPNEAMARCVELDGDAGSALRALHEETEGLWFAGRQAAPSHARQADALLETVERGR
jgi:hypothetical protein